MTYDELIVGMVVRHINNNEPLMTVEGWRNESEGDETGNGVFVVWFDRDDRLNRASFSAEMLMPYSEEDE